MILPNSTSKKRESILANALKQFNVDPQPIATNSVTNAFNSLRYLWHFLWLNITCPLRSDIIKLRDCETAILHCEIELQALSNTYLELNPGKSLPDGVDPPGKLKCHVSNYKLISYVASSRKRLLSETSVLPDKKKTKNCH